MREFGNDVEILYQELGQSDLRYLEIAEAERLAGLGKRWPILARIHTAAAPATQQYTEASQGVSKGVVA